MTRIFLTLATISTFTMGLAFWFGWDIGDAQLRDAVVQAKVGRHLLFGVAVIIFAVLVHALVLTYFMGTGRWLEETTNAYQLSGNWLQASRDLKLRTIPWMVLGILLLIVTGAFGGAADPASALGFHGWGTFSAAQVHMLIAATTVVVNIGVNVAQYRALCRNGMLVNEVMDRVREIRRAKGLT